MVNYSKLTKRYKKGTEMEEVKLMLVNGVEVKYVGQPFELAVFEFPNWHGRTNIHYVEYDMGIQIMNLADAFVQMRTMHQELGAKLFYGYVLDFKTRTAYYDDQKALDHLNLAFSEHKWEGYFTDFKKVDFRKEE